ncbi:unnamed protein product [Lactuca virosa]|uniref:Uncharacterized protein n=1 Tax=Lactuca virosa TaxID=75947 RepID=A0AAU9MLW5_9ASTR|nr:unnamed protein product [Lactuca virosa]
MASVEPILIPKSEESEWYQQISMIFYSQLDTNLENPSASIFLVPENIIKHKPEAYEPQQIGLGPKYHFQPWPYKKMEQRKLTAAKRLLPDWKGHKFHKHIIQKLYGLIPTIRACYETFLQDDNFYLAWILAIDGLFLLYHFHSYNSGVDYDHEERNELEEKKNESHEHIISLEVDPTRRLFAQDLMMVENQIPFMLLQELDKALQPSSGDSIDSVYNFSPSIYRSFCDTHSPLELCSQSQAPTLVDHLLHYMYCSIVTNIPEKVNQLPHKRPTFVYRMGEAGASPSKEEKGVLLPSGEPLIDTSLGKLNIPIVNFVQKIPWEKVFPLYEKTVTSLETFSHDKTDIPSVSKLHGAGFKFHLLPKDEGFWKIDSKGKDISLPCITLHTDSEVILRNLVAYEMIKANCNNFPLTEYVGLMCGLIMNVNDVKLLKRQKIIDGDLREDEVAKFFIGMRTSTQTVKTRKKSELQEKIVEVNRVYESRRRMLYLLMRKVSYWLLVVLRAVSIFAGASLKILAFIISLATVFLLTSQAYCEAYGCAKTKVSLLTLST